MIVEHEKISHRDSLAAQFAEVENSVRFRRDGLRDPAAEYNPGVRSQVGQRGIQRGTADVVEIDIDAAWAFAPDRGVEVVFGLVIYHAVQAKHLREEPAFLRPTSDANHATCIDQTDLRGDLPDSSRRRGNQ